MRGGNSGPGFSRWAAAFVAVAAAHVATAGAAMLPWSVSAEPEPVKPLPAAIMIDLAPAPSGKEVPAPEQTPRPAASPEPTPTPKPTPEPKPKPKPTPEPAPVPREVPPPVVEEAEIVLPAETQDEAVTNDLPVSDEPVAEPAPDIAATGPAETVAEVETEPPGNAAPGLDAPAPAAGRAVADAKAAWQAAVLGHLERHKRYPYIAQRKREEGIVYIRFVMDRSGRILSGSVERGASSRALNEEAIALLSRAEPLPVPPGEVSGQSLELVLPIRFFMRD